MATKHPIELILARQLAETMSHPVWITDANGNLVFYNEPAESILGVRFDEAGEMPAADLAEKFLTQDLDGTDLRSEELPLVVALTDWIPAHRPCGCLDSTGGGARSVSLPFLWLGLANAVWVF